jgi:CubicO group peptidase (beta-lactamase class C family)
MRSKKWILLNVFFISTIVLAQNPGAQWLQYKTPEEAGWSSTELDKARQCFDTLGSAAFMAVYNGRVLVVWGDIERRFMCHSIRKSYLSALYGIHVDEGRIDINKTIGELGIVDKQPLTETEKRATVRDLLKARSGVYLPAAYETARMKQLRPLRGSHAPNTFWYYNNWDFNVLGTIFRQVTGKDLFEEFKVRLAEPLQMQDYRLIDGYYHLEKENSLHPAYPFKMSARDMARFGVLFAQQGRWNERQIVSDQWIKESTTSYSEAGEGGYAYLWWIQGPTSMPGFYTARGSGGHIIGVAPKEKFVFVHRVDTYRRKRVEYAQGFKLAKMVLEARTGEPKEQPELVVLKSASKPIEFVRLSTEVLARYVGTYPAYNDTVQVKMYEDGLLMELAIGLKFRLFPVSTKKFLMEDREDYVEFELDEKGKPAKLMLPRTNRD